MITIWKYHVDNESFQRKIVEPTKELTQKVSIITYVRFNVTTCLYLSPNNRARSLSTLMAVIVNKDTKHNVRPVMTNVANVERQISHRSYTTENH